MCFAVSDLCVFCDECAGADTAWVGLLSFQLSSLCRDCSVRNSGGRACFTLLYFGFGVITCLFLNGRACCREQLVNDLWSMIVRCGFDSGFIGSAHCVMRVAGRCYLVSLPLIAVDDLCFTYFGGFGFMILLEVISLRCIKVDAYVLTVLGLWQFVYSAFTVIYRYGVHLMTNEFGDFDYVLDLLRVIGYVNLLDLQGYWFACITFIYDLLRQFRAFILTDFGSLKAFKLAYTSCLVSTGSVCYLCVCNSVVSQETCNFNLVGFCDFGIWCVLLLFVDAHAFALDFWRDALVLSVLMLKWFVFYLYGCVSYDGFTEFDLFMCLWWVLVDIRLMTLCFGFLKVAMLGVWVNFVDSVVVGFLWVTTFENSACLGGLPDSYDLALFIHYEQIGFHLDACRRVVVTIYYDGFRYDCFCWFMLLLCFGFCSFLTSIGVTCYCCFYLDGLCCVTCLVCGVAVLRGTVWCLRVCEILRMWLLCAQYFYL
eukprot:gene2525-1580_t